MVKLFGILGNDAKNALKSFWEKHGLVCVYGVTILYLAIPWFLSGVCGIRITSIAGNTVLFVLMLLVASLIGLSEVENEDGFLATGGWYVLFFYLMILSPFVALSNLYELWGLAMVATVVLACLYGIVRFICRAYRYGVSVWKKLH